MAKTPRTNSLFNSPLARHVNVTSSKSLETEFNRNVLQNRETIWSEDLYEFNKSNVVERGV